MALRVPPAPQLPTVRQAAMPGVQVGQDTRGTHGEEVGAALQQAGGALSQAALKALDSANATARDSSLANFQEKSSHRATEFHQLKGQTAAANSADFFEGLQKDMEETAQGLTPYQRQDFEKHARGLLLNMHLSAERHVASESRAARAAAAEALAEKTRGGVVNVYGDPAALAAHLRPAEESIRDFGTREGLPPDAIDLKVSKYLAGIDADVLGLYADAGRYEEAQSYLERPEVKERMGNKALRVGETLQKKRVERDAIATAADIDAASREEETGWFDEGKAFMLLQHVPTEQREKAESVLRDAAANGRRQRQADIGAHYAVALRAMQEGPTRGPEAIGRIPVDESDWLKAHATEEWEKLLRGAKRDAKEREGRASGRLPQATEAENKALNDFHFLLSSDPETRARLAQLTPEEYERQYGYAMHSKGKQKGYDSVLRERERIQRAGQVASPDVGGIVFGLAGAHKLFPKDRNKWQSHHVTMSNELIDAGNDYVAHERGKRSGAYPSNLEVETELRKKFDERLVDGFLTPTKTTKIQVKHEPRFAGEQPLVRDAQGNLVPAPAEGPAMNLEQPPAAAPARKAPPPPAPEEVRIDDIPPENQDAIRKSLRKNKKPVTNANIRRLYEASKKAQPPKR